MPKPALARTEHGAGGRLPGWGAVRPPVARVCSRAAGRA